MAQNQIQPHADEELVLRASSALKQRLRHPTKLGLAASQLSHGIDHDRCDKCRRDDPEPSAGSKRPLEERIWQLPEQRHQ